MRQITEDQIKSVSKAILDNQFDIAGWSVSPSLMIASMASMKILAKWAQEQMKPDWISVKDRLPETIRLLAFTGGLTITLTYIDGIYYSGDGHIWCSEVTHWMPLPTSPR